MSDGLLIDMYDVGYAEDGTVLFNQQPFTGWCVRRYNYKNTNDAVAIYAQYIDGELMAILLEHEYQLRMSKLGRLLHE